MSKLKLRESIAYEAARLVFRGKETDYAAARKRAARWLSRRKVDAAVMPTDSEIHTQFYALAGLFSAEHEQRSLYEIRSLALEMMETLQAFGPRLSGCAVDGPVMEGSPITLTLDNGSREDVLTVLHEAGFRTHIASQPEAAETIETYAEMSSAGIPLNRRFLCTITFNRDEKNGDEKVAETGIGIDAVRELLQAVQKDGNFADDSASQEDYHPDLFTMIRMLLQRLENVFLDPELHPEGDALYHSLQVYELALADRAYDEEFLLACLLHDVGLGIAPRRPTEAAVEALGGLITERTRFLIEHRPDALEFLKTGKMPRSLRRSEHFEDLLLLARCDLDGRVQGAQVSELDEALDYIAGLSTAWDDV